SDVTCLDASTVQGQLERDVQALLSLYQERENLFVHQNLLHSWKSWFSGANWAPPSGHGEGRFESKLVRVFQSWFKPLVLLMVVGDYGSEREPSSWLRRDLMSPSGAISSVVLACDPQLPHLGIQGSSLQPETCRTPLRPADDALGLAQDAEDVLAVRRLQACRRNGFG